MALEGSVIDASRELTRAASWAPRATTRFAIASVTPQPSLLILRFEPGSDLRRFITDVTPVAHEGEIKGVPGLRATAHRLGTLLHRPGAHASVLIPGTDVTAWEAHHRAGWPAAHSHGSCLNAAHPGDWAREEIEFQNEYPSLTKYQRLQALLLRRIGLFNRLKPTAMHTYTSPGTGIVVEIYPEHYDYGQHDRFIEAMTSPDLAPQLTCVGRRVSAHGPEHENSRSISFQIPGASHELEVRIVNPHYEFRRVHEKPIPSPQR